MRIEAEKELWDTDLDIDESLLEMDFDEAEALDSISSSGEYATTSRSLAAWQRVEDRFDERRLREALGDWDDWSDYMAEH